MCHVNIGSDCTQVDDIIKLCVKDAICLSTDGKMLFCFEIILNCKLYHADGLC